MRDVGRLVSASKKKEIKDQKTTAARATFATYSRLSSFVLSLDLLGCLPTSTHSTHPLWWPLTNLWWWPLQPRFYKEAGWDRDCVWTFETNAQEWWEGGAEGDCRLEPKWRPGLKCFPDSDTKSFSPDQRLSQCFETKRNNKKVKTLGWLVPVVVVRAAATVLWTFFSWESKQLDSCVKILISKPVLSTGDIYSSYDWSFFLCRPDLVDFALNTS